VLDTNWLNKLVEINQNPQVVSTVVELRSKLQISVGAGQKVKQCIFQFFSFLVAPTVVIFLGIHLPNFVQFKQY